jgi:MFS family permease
MVVTDGRRQRVGRIHPAWFVAAAAFVALLGAAGFRSAPGVFIVPLQEEFGWTRGTLSLAVSVNLVLFGLMAPFAAALMDRFGVRAVVATALTLIAIGSGSAVFVTASWQLVLLWGVVVGIGTGSMALVFAATIANRWFVRRRGLVMGVLTAGSATGQLIFLPVLATVTERTGWRVACLIVAGAALAVVPLVLRFLHSHPRDRGVLPYGGTAADEVPADTTSTPADAVRRAVTALREAARSRTFWALAGGFAICGATTNGLIGTHFIPAAHDHGMGQTTAAGLLAVVGVFDIVGTIASGFLTDRFNPRVLLAVYYSLRGVGLVMLPGMLGDTLHPSMIGFVIVYGLDWVATVPPTVALCREAFGRTGTIVFGWVFASHQIGAAIGSGAAGLLRDGTGSYTIAWFGAAGLCVVAAAVSIGIRRWDPPAGEMPVAAAPADAPEPRSRTSDTAPVD